jgi:hypothetical protein
MFTAPLFIATPKEETTNEWVSKWISKMWSFLFGNKSK